MRILNSRKKLHVSVFMVLFLPFFVSAQVYGPELVTSGNFGSVSDGKNGDDINERDSLSRSIYSQLDGNTQNIPIYYQPAKWVYHNGNYVYTEINPKTTLGYPIGTKTEYSWGFNENWNSDYYTFPNESNGPTNVNIPNAPNNGKYLITTSTNGMYNLPSLNAAAWYQVVDKYETNPENPVNYFLVINADQEANKVFFRETGVRIVPGQLYRMSVDIVKINKPGQGDPPSVNMAIRHIEGNDTTLLYVYHTGVLPDSQGEWINYDFNFVAPADLTNYDVDIAFRNDVSGGNGNDLALDNLSMIPIYPLVTVEGGCDEATAQFTNFTFKLNGGITNAYTFDANKNNYTYYFQWERSTDNGVTFSGLGAESTTYADYATADVGVFRLAVYTDVTRDNKMYSNAFTISTSQTVCGDNVPNLNRPDAQDDNYNVNPDISTQFDLYANDQTSDMVAGGSDDGRARLTVSKFVIDGVTYVAGQTALIENVGIVTIQPKGYLTFRSVPDFIGTVPQIQYTIVELNGGSDSAVVNITMNQFSWVIDASCVSCPITVAATSLLSASLSDTDDYILYKGNTMMRNPDNSVVKGVKSNADKTLTFNFYETQSGTINYTVRQGNETQNVARLTFDIDISPDSATWAPNMVIFNDGWEDARNWKSSTGAGAPKWCTDVRIPGNADYYMVVNNGVDDPPSACRDIYFDDGATVSQIHHLNYRRAYVNLTPERDKWALYSAPLQYMYSADYHADPSWGDKAAINPRIYMRYFNVKYNEGLQNPDSVAGTSVGDFSLAFADLKQKMDMGKAFVLAVDAKGDNDKFKDDTFYFPRLLENGDDVEFYYHYKSTGNWILDNSKYPAYKPDRGEAAFITDADWLDINTNPDRVGERQLRGQDSRYRFVFETIGSTAIPQSLTISGLNAGKSNIIGNPFMSHLDIDQLWETNMDKFNPYYRVWDGEKFYTYLITNDGETIWQGELPDGTVTDENGNPPLAQQIPPMAGFIIDMIGDATEIEIIPNLVSTKPYMPYSNADTEVPEVNVGTGSAKVIQKKNTYNKPQNVLSLVLKMNENKSRAVVGLFHRASDNYKPAEDVYKLFSPLKNVPEIYTVSEGNAIEINALNDAASKKILPIGIKTTEKGHFSITVENTDNFNAYAYLHIWDAKENIFYDVLRQPTVNLTKDVEDNVEGRYYLIMEESPTGVDEIINGVSFVNVSVRESWITIKSDAALINRIELFDLAGRKIYQKNSLNSNEEHFTAGTDNGIYIIRVHTNKGKEEYKIII